MSVGNRIKGYRVVTPTWDGDLLHSLDRDWVERLDLCELVSELEIRAPKNGAVLHARASVYIDGNADSAEHHFPTQQQLTELGRVCGECGMKAGLPSAAGRRFDVGKETTVFPL